MTKSQKWISILLALSIALILVSSGWKSSFFGIGMLVNLWLSPKEPRLSKPAKIAGFGSVLALMAVGFYFLFQQLSTHF